MGKFITEKTTIRDIFDLVEDPKEIDIGDLKAFSFYNRHKDWDGTQGHLWKIRETTSSGDFRRICNVDLKYPIIVSARTGRYCGIIDGHHRLMKTIQNKLPVITVRVISYDNFTREELKIIGSVLQNFIR